MNEQQTDKQICKEFKKEKLNLDRLIFLKNKFNLKPQMKNTGSLGLVKKSELFDIFGSDFDKQGYYLKSDTVQILVTEDFKEVYFV